MSPSYYTPPFTPSSNDLMDMIRRAEAKADAAVARARAEAEEVENTRQAEREARVERVKQRRARWGY